MITSVTVLTKITLVVLSLAFKTNTLEARVISMVAIFAGTSHHSLAPNQWEGISNCTYFPHPQAQGWFKSVHVHLLRFLLLITVKRFALPEYLTLCLCQSFIHLRSPSSYHRMQFDSKKNRVKKKKKRDQLEELRWQELLERKKL